MLNELTIDGLKGVGRAELRFERDSSVRVLFGSNGVGKTKCLEAIYQFLLLSNKTFLDQTSYGVEPASFAVMRSAHDDEDHVFKVPSVLPNQMILISQIWGALSKGFHDLPVVFVGAVHRSTLDVGAPHANLGTFDVRRRAYFNELFQTQQTGQLKTAGMITNVQAWFVVRAQSDNPYQKGADNRRVEIETVMELLHALDERIDPSSLQIDGSGYVSLHINDQRLGLNQLSSGFTSLVKLVQAIVSGYANFTNEANLRYVRGVVLIDEIESHLHAQWQSRIIPKLKALLPHTTFYIATHSPLVLAQLEEGEAYVLERDGDGVVRSQMVISPNKRAFADVLADAFGVDLNKLKRESLEKDDQTQAKRALLALLDDAKGSQP